MEKNSTLPRGLLDVQAHRGGRGLMPENTVASMLNGLAFGVRTLEMDVVISKDRKVLLSHEPFFNHEITTKPDGKFVTEAEERSLNIYQMNYEDVKKYDVGLKPHPRFLKQEKVAAIKPLLSDVFEAVKKYMAEAKRPYPFFNIETKTDPLVDGTFHPAPEEFVDLLMAVVKEYDLEKQVIIQSFDFRTLKYLHKKYPSIKTAMLVEANDKRSFRKQLDDLGFTPTIHSPAFELVTANLVKECHKRNIQIIPWTANEKALFDKLKAMGVDGIITDYPNLNEVRF
ncbi:MAG: glycerophosphodiester phosphodiesterase [Chitinophagaceae bacterium]|nr:MAG: glycerophosphodiester phosphodiesterase [Chitinophagaceae bacterium]